MSIYANSDTTEYRVGDVVRDAEGAILFRTDDPRLPWEDRVGCVEDEWTPPRPLTLLARDGVKVSA